MGSPSREVKLLYNIYIKQYHIEFSVCICTVCCVYMLAVRVPFMFFSANRKIYFASLTRRITEWCHLLFAVNHMPTIFLFPSRNPKSAFYTMIFVSHPTGPHCCHMCFSSFSQFLCLCIGVTPKSLWSWRGNMKDSGSFSLKLYREF